MNPPLQVLNIVLKTNLVNLINYFHTISQFHLIRKSHDFVFELLSSMKFPSSLFKTTNNAQKSSFSSWMSTKTFQFVLIKLPAIKFPNKLLWSNYKKRMRMIIICTHGLKKMYWYTDRISSSQELNSCEALFLVTNLSNVSAKVIIILAFLLRYVAQNASC